MSKENRCICPMKGGNGNSMQKKESIALVNGNVITMEEDQRIAEAILVENGMVKLLGESKDILAYAKEKMIPVLDLQGKTALPGFHDCHVHVMGTGMAALGREVYDCKSVQEVISALQEEALRSDTGWICGIRLDESRLTEKRPPTMEELDRYFPNRGVYLVDRGLHYTVVNKKAYDEIGFTGEEKGIGKDKNGKPTGRLHELANAMARNYFNDTMTDQQRREAIESVTKTAARKGITTIHAMEGGEMFSDHDIKVFLDLEGKTEVDIVLYWDTFDIEAIEKAGLTRIGTDILADGSIGSRTAAFDEPYADDPSTSGVLYYMDEYLTDFIARALEHHLQCGFHTIGQKTIRQVIDCYEKAYERCPWEDARFRMEHFGFCDDRDIERAAKNRIIISTQPSFSYLRGGEGSVYQIRTGVERERKAYPNRKFLDAGIVVAGGSDSNVTPMDALLGIHSAVNHPYPEHRVTVEEALRMFTIDGAYSAREEEVKGSLKVGKIGDLVVLSEDPYKVDKERIKDISVEMTIKEGNIIYCNGKNE